MNHITLQTNHPIAFNSPDHLMPWGTRRDNHTNPKFIEEIHQYFKLKHEVDNFNFLDLGCSGGQLVVDLHNNGNIAVGLEGSDYSVKHQRANWPEYHNKILFTCDVTKPYTIYNNSEKVEFDMITAWEVVEHIHPDDLSAFFLQISNNLKFGGVFLASISTKEDVIQGYKLHQTVWDEITWYKNFPKLLKETNLETYQYPFEHKVRWDGGSFHILLQKS